MLLPSINMSWTNASLELALIGRDIARLGENLGQILENRFNSSPLIWHSNLGVLGSRDLVSSSWSVLKIVSALCAMYSGRNESLRWSGELTVKAIVSEQVAAYYRSGR